MICYGCTKEAPALFPTYWTEEKVCAQCVLHSDEFMDHVFANLPTPPAVLEAVLKSPTIEAVREAFRMVEPMQSHLFPELDTRKPMRVSTEIYNRKEIA